MKKLFFMVALGVAGMMSANRMENEVTIPQKSFTNEVTFELNVLTPPEHDWIEVETWCGKVFYLDNNDYSSFQEIGTDANYFTDQQCGKYPG